MEHNNMQSNIINRIVELDNIKLYSLIIGSLFLTITILLIFTPQFGYANNNTTQPKRIVIGGDPREENTSRIMPASLPSIGMVTGPRVGTYIKIGEDISRIAEKEGLKIDVKESGGSIDNIKRINSKENAAFGIVQSDVLSLLKRSKNPKTLAFTEKIRMIYPFFNEEVHVIASKNIKKFDDLNGKKVVVGKQGSGHWITAMNLFSITGIKPSEKIRIEPAQGVVEVLSGRADAMIFVGGKPVKLFNNLSLLQGKSFENRGDIENLIHFIPLKDNRILNEYQRALISHNDYNIIPKDKPIPTVSVTAILVSYNFADVATTYGKKRCDNIGKLAHSIDKYLRFLQKYGHPKWQEVKPNSHVATWKRDSCALKYHVSNSRDRVKAIQIN